MLTSNGIFTIPLVTVFTKFDGQIIHEYAKLNDIKDGKKRWDMASINADNSFQEIYLPKVMSTQYPPTAYVRLQGDTDEHCATNQNKYSDKIILQIWTYQKMTVLNCLRQLLIQLMMPACDNCLSQHK